jgi:hypothetical protein
MAASSATSKILLGASHRTSSPWHRISDALSNNDLFVVVAFACIGLLLSLVLLQAVPLSTEMATLLSSAS